ncbi:MAG TPA: ferric reductase-like transmembrane domain-containing protein [Gaiellaceae bacterium]|nr:ferric reductase-like transmembrane domain-containing protein [Gaiellaceae bacterium]
MHVTSSPAIWYAARASGIAAYVVLSIVVSIGLGLGGKAQSKRWPRFSVEDIHRFGGLLVGSLVSIHVLTIAIDSFLPFSVVNLIVPFTAKYRPLWTGLGIAAAEILLALAITNHYRKRLPYRFWRLAHYLNFAVWTLASLHGLFAGTDRGVWWLAILYGVCVATVVMLLFWRFGGYFLRSGRVALAGGVTAIALPLLIVGPLHHNPPVWNAANVSEQLTGTVIRNGTNLKQIVSFIGQSQSPQKLLVRADLLVSPSSLQSTSLQLEYLPSGDLCKGKVTGVGGTNFSGTCRLANGQRRTVSASWSANSTGTGVVGEIQLSGA